jgi:hypothetical protein
MGTGKIRQNHFELMLSQHSSTMSLSPCFCATKQQGSSTILGWLNIRRSRYETQVYKEILLCAHTSKKMPLAYLSWMNATFATLDLSGNL